MNRSRRVLLCQMLVMAGAGLAPATRLAASETVLELTWPDLVPEENAPALERLRGLGIVQHGQMSEPEVQSSSGQLTDEYNGKLIRIPGYLVPLDQDGKGMTSALLVPYVGACIHVPPPPPNQLILVTTQEPYENAGLFEPVYVTGVFGTAATQTELAEVGYALSAEQIEPYG